MPEGNPMPGPDQQGEKVLSDISKKTVDELFRELSSSERGISSDETIARQKKYGMNEISEKRISPFIKFLQYFYGPIPFMIEVAVVLSALISHWEDFFIILALLLTNAFVGFYQERKAGNAIELLKLKLAPTAKVIRDGEWSSIPAIELVPGDVVRVRLGDIVPADVKLFKGQYLEVDQSALTGESLPVEKAVNDVAYSGSIVRKGEMDALVVTTGMNTYFGKTTKLVEEATSESHFQKNVVKIGNYLIVIAAILVVIVFIVSMLRNQGLLETLQFALVLTIAGIPVALPAVLSVTLAVGAIVLAKKEALVSKLTAIEELAGMDVLCSDKTGTITKNQLTVAKVTTYGDFKESEVLMMAALASRAEDKDPIDNAVLEKNNATADTHARMAGFKIDKFTPFDPVSKRTEAVVTGKEGTFQVAKGAPQVILEMAENKESVRAQVERDVQEMAEVGYRSLGVIRKADGGWQFLGVLGLQDPPRDDSRETIRQAKRMGVDVKMVTGDHIAIAKQVSKQVGLGTNITPASDILSAPDDVASDMVEKADGFAEVFPEHKYRIVDLLQKKGHIVGMTGDGVNDAPALKKANAGIAVQGATDAAKSAADIVLTRPGLSVIIDSIVESRKIFQRMINYSIYRISETIRLLFFVTLSIIVFQFYPITALMIVLLALLNDLPILTISYDNVRYSAKPEKWDLRTVIWVATFLGMIGVAVSIFTLYLGVDVFHLDQFQIQSFVYLKLSVGGHLVLLVARTKGHFWTVKPAKPLIIAIIITQLVATILVTFGILLPLLPIQYVAFIWAEMLIVFVITDYLKVGLYSYLIGKGELAKGISSQKELEAEIGQA
jgi:H+-transporting ATPase